MAGKRKDERPTHKRYNAERRDLINKAKRILRNNLPKYEKIVTADGKKIIDYTRPIIYSKFQLQELVNKYIEASKQQGAIGAAKSLLILKTTRMEEKNRATQLNRGDAHDTSNFQKIHRKKKIYDPDAEAKRKADQTRRAARRTET
mgnify:CR=1 FL=1